MAAKTLTASSSPSPPSDASIPELQGIPGTREHLVNEVHFLLILYLLPDPFLRPTLPLSSLLICYSHSHHTLGLLYIQIRLLRSMLAERGPSHPPNDDSDPSFPGRSQVVWASKCAKLMTAVQSLRVQVRASMHLYCLSLSFLSLCTCSVFPHPCLFQALCCVLGFTFLSPVPVPTSFPSSSLPSPLLLKNEQLRSLLREESSSTQSSGEPTSLALFDDLSSRLVDTETKLRQAESQLGAAHAVIGEQRNAIDKLTETVRKHTASLNELARLKEKGKLDGARMTERETALIHAHDAATVAMKESDGASDAMKGVTDIIGKAQMQEVKDELKDAQVSYYSQRTSFPNNYYQSD